MTETSKFWPNVSYGDDDFAEVLNRFFQNGVISGVANELIVTAPGGMAVAVNTGEAFCNGAWYQNDASKTLAIAASDPSNPRIDRVILRRDASGNTCALAILTGVPAGSPSAPALTQNSSTWEISLAQVAVGAGVVAIIAGNLSDERTLKANGTPKNGIIFTTDAAAPAGWAEYTAARGRTIVGLPSGGTIAGTVGTALTDIQDKTHTHTGPSHTHPQNISADVGQTPNGIPAAYTSSASGGVLSTGVGAGGTGYQVYAGVSASGTGASGTAALSTFFAYIQLLCVKRS